MMYNVRIIYHFVLCSFRMCVVVLTGPTSSPGRIKRAEFSGPPPPLSRWSFHPHLHCTRASRRDAHTHTRLGQGGALYYTRGHYIPRQPDRYDDATVDSSWSACFTGETPVRFFFLLLLSRHLYYYIKLYVYGPGVVFVRFRSPLGKAAAATAVCRALDACACARAHPPVAV